MVDGARLDAVAALITDEACDVLVSQRRWSLDDYETWRRESIDSLVLDGDD